MQQSTVASVARTTNSGAMGRIAFLGFLLIGSALLGAYFYIGPFGSDDLQYVQLAAGGAPSLGTGRYAISGFYWLMANWLGIQQAAYSFFLFGAAIGIATYFLARKFVDEHVAMLAALLAAFNPLTFYYSAAILPDNPLGLFYLIHVGAFATYVWGGRRICYAALSGAMLAACYATKEAAMVFALPTLVVGGRLLLWQRAAVWKGVLAFAVAFVGVVVVDMLVSYVLFNDPIYRLTYSASHDVVGKAKEYMQSQGVLPWERAGYVVDRAAAFMPKSLLFLYALAIVVVPLLAWWRRRDHFAPALYLSACVFVVFAYLTWGTISLRDYIGVPLQVRYYLPAIPLAAICIAVLLWEGSTRLPRASRAGVVLFWLVGAGILLVQVMHPAPHAGRAYRAQEVVAIGRAVAIAQRERPGVPLVGDSYVSGRYAGYGPQMGVLDRKEIARRGLHDFILVIADTNQRKEAEIEAVGRCAQSVEELVQSDALRIPATRRADIGLMLGDPSRVQFEPKARVKLFEVQQFRKGCQA